MDEGNESVRLLMGDYRKAMWKMSVPMIIAMAVQMAYNLFDAIWVSGLGADALAAVAFVFPLFFVVMGLANGIGVGATAAISRRIGSGDKRGADSVATHTMALVAVISICLTVPFVILADDIFTWMGAGDAIPLATSYAQVLFSGTIIIFFASVAMAILRGEGDAKRSMYIMVIGSVLNIVLDPIFIYGLDMGIAGAAWATLLAFGVSASVMIYWLMIKRDTYVTISIKGFRWDRAILRDIFKVGLPASVMQISMALTQFVVNLIILMVGSTDGVAVYGTGWRIISFQMVPLFGIAAALTPVVGAAYGSKKFSKIGGAHLYGTKMGLALELILTALVLIAAPWLALIFTSTGDSQRLYGDIVTFLRIATLFVPFVSLGMLSSAMFQGVGKGNSALLATLIRSVFLTILLTYLLGVVMGMGLEGIWWGVALANFMGSLIVFIWARLYTRRLNEEMGKRCHLTRE